MCVAKVVACYSKQTHPYVVYILLSIIIQRELTMLFSFNSPNEIYQRKKNLQNITLSIKKNPKRQKEKTKTKTKTKEQSLTQNLKVIC
ncbi:hypothetical protein CANARDRAFT_69105 [[Candida] arabinofermentans NRRL YB-2248]|uniref:Uncharacterized protein n=1 Tax=[Candida] arabinofermentans NRRL YB-2248 TaxID=983967 RepID=A0A1E4SXJ6_9ASCO|nr:hypothetical protein CANARDRAFT_69105 [[Candida] arabinofermentans NRRL YB-2248]